MSITAKDSSRQLANQLIETRTVEIVAAAYGVAIVTVAQMPILDLTEVGALIRYVEVVSGVLLFAFNLQTVMARFTAGETLILLGFCATLFISMLSGVSSAVNPDPGMLLRQLLLNVVVYGVAKLLITEEGFERYLRWYFYLCLFAAIQAIAAGGAEVLRIRAIHEIPVFTPSHEGYYLSWWGLLGADGHNFRTNFYFSESSHFAHMLLPGIIYAFVRRRALSLFILLVGFLTTAAAFASIILVCVMPVAVARFRGNFRTTIALSAFVAVILGALLALLSSSAFLFTRFFIRDTSIDSKIDTLQYTFVQLREYPFGLGSINLPDYFSDTGLNTSSGLFGIVASFGFPGLVLLLAVGLFLVIVTFRRREDYRSAATALGIVAVLGATFSHGPTFKYYLLFMLSSLQSFRLLIAQQTTSSGRHKTESRAKELSLSAR